MDFQEEIQTLKKRADNLQRAHAKIEAQLNDRKEKRDKILKDLADKNIDPDKLPDLIRAKETQLKKKISEFNEALDRVEQEIAEVQAKL